MKLAVDVGMFYHEVHQNFVFREASNAAAKWRGNPNPSGCVEIVRRAIVSNPRGCLVAVMPEDHDLFAGFLICSGPQRIAYAYVKYPLRRMGVASMLATLAGIDLSKPTGLAIWTPAASRIAAAGYRLYPETEER